MKTKVYFLQFKGPAAPVEGSPNVMSAATTAGGCHLVSELGSGGPAGSLKAAGSGTAHFKSVVTIVGEGRFVESGTIDYGGGAVLSFVTAGEGVIGPSAESGLTSGSVIWKVVEGKGPLAGASGYITSNFTVGSDGAVVDNQTAVILLP